MAYNVAQLREITEILGAPSPTYDVRKILEFLVLPLVTVICQMNLPPPLPSVRTPYMNVPLPTHNRTCSSRRRVCNLRRRRKRSWNKRKRKKIMNSKEI